MNKFMWFPNFRDAIKKFPREKQLELREAIEDYVFDGVEPSDPMIAFAIQLIKPSLEYKGRGG